MLNVEAVTAAGMVTLQEEFDNEHCCQAGFDVEGEISSDYRQALLSACTQTYVWEAESELCTLISYNEGDESLVDEMRSKEECC